MTVELVVTVRVWSVDVSVIYLPVSRTAHNLKTDLTKFKIIQSLIYIQINDSITEYNCSVKQCSLVFLAVGVSNFGHTMYKDYSTPLSLAHCKVGQKLNFSMKET